MKTILLILTLTLILTQKTFANPLDDQLKNLTHKQAGVMYKTYYAGKPFDLEWTLTAIAWREASFKEGAFNPVTRDYGLFQINYYTYTRRFAKDIEQTGISDSSLRKLLRYDFQVGLSAAVAELTFWKKARRGNWLDIWASYNTGTVLDNKGRIYAAEIEARIHALQRYFKAKGIK